MRNDWADRPELDRGSLTGCAAKRKEFARNASLSATNTWLSAGNSPVISCNISSRRSFCLHRSTSSLLYTYTLVMTRYQDFNSYIIISMWYFIKYRDIDINIGYFHNNEHVNLIQAQEQDVSIKQCSMRYLDNKNELTKLQYGYN